MRPPEADQRLRPRVTIDLSPSYQLWLDNQFSDDSAFDTCGDLSQPVEYVHHAAVYWAASAHRRPVRDTVHVDGKQTGPDVPVWVVLACIVLSVVGGLYVIFELWALVASWF